MIYRIYNKDYYTSEQIIELNDRKIKDERYIEYREYNESIANKCTMLVKENINSDDFLKLVLKYHNKNKNKLTHAFVVEDDEGKFIIADCVINPNPDAKTKVLIAERAMKLFSKLGYKYFPIIVNFLTPNGHLSLSVPESVENNAICQIMKSKYNSNDYIFDMRQLDYCLYEKSRTIKELGKQWGLISDHNRNANIIIANNLSEGNSVFKCLLNNKHAYGYVLGADITVILNSRSNLDDNDVAIATAFLELS